MHVSGRISLATLALALLGHSSVCLSADEAVVEEEGQRAEGYPVPVTAEVRSGNDVRIHSGTITVDVGVKIRLDYGVVTSAIALGYSGTEGAHCCWLQIVWREVLVTRSGATTAIVGTVATPYGSYSLTTDASRPTYRVDGTPCYEDEGASNDSTGLTIFDRPGVPMPALMAPREADVTRIESVGHFDSFFVCGGTILVHVAWTATYTWIRGTGWTGPVYGVSPPDTSGERPNDGQLRQLGAQYPGQGVVR